MTQKLPNQTPAGQRPPPPPASPKPRIICGLCGPLNKGKHSNWLCRLFSRDGGAVLGPVSEPPAPGWMTTQLEIFALYPIGYEFLHRGRSLIVTGHRAGMVALFSNSMYISPLPPVMPAVIAQYADDYGQIREIRFEPIEFAFLRSLKDRTKAHP